MANICLAVKFELIVGMNSPNIRGKRDNGYFGYQFAMAVAIAVPIILSQNYIEKVLKRCLKDDASDTQNMEIFQ